MLPKKNSGIFSDGRCRRRCCCHRRLIAAASAVVVRFQRLILRWCESINENRNIQHAFFPSSHKASNVCETETLWRNSFLRSFLLDVIWIFLFFKVFHYSVKAISSRRRQFNNSDHLLANSVYLETQASFCNNFFFILPLRFFVVVFVCFRTIWHLLIAMRRSISFYSSCSMKHFCVCDFFLPFDMKLEGSPECVTSIYSIHFDSIIMDRKLILRFSSPFSFNRAVVRTIREIEIER